MTGTLCTLPIGNVPHSVSLQSLHSYDVNQKAMKVLKVLRLLFANLYLAVFNSNGASASRQTDLVAHGSVENNGDI